MGQKSKNGRFSLGFQWNILRMQWNNPYIYEKKIFWRKKTASSGTFQLNMVSEQCAGVGEKTEDEEKRQHESDSENEVEELVCPLDALHWMEQTICFNSYGNTCLWYFPYRLCGENEPVEAQKSIHRRWVRAPKNWQVQVETTSACCGRSSHANWNKDHSNTVS